MGVYWRWSTCYWWIVSVFKSVKKFPIIVKNVAFHMSFSANKLFLCLVLVMWTGGQIVTSVWHFFNVRKVSHQHVDLSKIWRVYVWWVVLELSHVVTIISLQLEVQNPPDMLVVSLSTDIWPLKLCIYRGNGCTSAPLTNHQNVLTSIYTTGHHKYLAFKKWHKKRKVGLSQFPFYCSSSGGGSHSTRLFPPSHHCLHY